MSAFIQPGETDDPYFVELLNGLIRALISRLSPRELWVIQIDNWFDHKWLRFSGIGSVHFAFPAFMNRNDSALEESFREKVTFPPFNPNRIASQCSFLRVRDEYVEAALPGTPHTSERKPSKTNLQRRIETFSGSVTYVWYSGKTVGNGKGSVMVYTVGGDKIDCWFAAFDRRNDWTLRATKGVSRTAVEEMLSSTTP